MKLEAFSKSRKSKRKDRRKKTHNKAEKAGQRKKLITSASLIQIQKKRFIRKLTKRALFMINLET